MDKTIMKGNQISTKFGWVNKTQCFHYSTISKKQALTYV